MRYKNYQQFVRALSSHHYESNAKVDIKKIQYECEDIFLELNDIGIYPEISIDQQNFIFQKHTY